MSALLPWFGLTFLALMILLLIAVLCFPVVFSLEAEKTDRLRFLASVKWLGIKITFTPKTPASQKLCACP